MRGSPLQIVCEIDCVETFIRSVQIYKSFEYPDETHQTSRKEWHERARDSVEKRVALEDEKGGPSGRAEEHDESRLVPTKQELVQANRAEQNRRLCGLDSSCMNSSHPCIVLALPFFFANLCFQPFSVTCQVFAMVMDECLVIQGRHVDCVFVQPVNKGLPPLWYHRVR